MEVKCTRCIKGTIKGNYDEYSCINCGQEYTLFEVIKLIFEQTGELPRELIKEGRR